MLDSILNLIRNIFHSTLREFDSHLINAATPFTRHTLKIFKFLLSPVCYVIHHNHTNPSSQISESSTSQSKRVICPICKTSQNVNSDNITLRKHGTCGKVIISTNSTTHSQLLVSSSYRENNSIRRIHNRQQNSNNNSQISNNTPEILLAISQLKSKFNKGSKAAAKRLWANQSAGPKFIQLELAMQASINPKQDIAIQSILQEILLDTPPFSNKDKSVDSNTSSLGVGFPEDFSDDFIPSYYIINLQ